MVAQAMGHKPGAKYKYSAPPVYLFEPHQPEQCNYKPDLILKIDEVWETKYKAFQILAAQKHLWDYYERRRAQPRHPGLAQYRHAHDLRRGLSDPFPARRHGHAWLKPEGNEHEARRRPHHQTRRSQRRRHARRRRRVDCARGARPLRADEALSAADLCRRRDRRAGGDRAGAAGRQLDDPCRGRAMPEGRRAGGRLHRRQYRRHVRRIAGDRAAGARRGRPGDRRRLPRREGAARRWISRSGRRRSRPRAR